MHFKLFHIIKMFVIFLLRFEMVGDLESDVCTKLYANGCLPRVYYLVYQSAGLLGAGAMTIAFIQVNVSVKAN